MLLNRTFSLACLGLISCLLVGIGLASPPQATHDVNQRQYGRRGEVQFFDTGRDLEGNVVLLNIEENGAITLPKNIVPPPWATEFRVLYVTDARISITAENRGNELCTYYTVQTGFNVAAFGLGGQLCNQICDWNLPTQLPIIQDWEGPDCRTIPANIDNVPSPAPNLWIPVEWFVPELRLEAYYTGFGDWNMTSGYSSHYPHELRYNELRIGVEGCVQFR